MTPEARGRAGGWGSPVPKVRGRVEGSPEPASGEACLGLQAKRRLRKPESALGRLCQQGNQGLL
jgi:hypothetical protein